MADSSQDEVEMVSPIDEKLFTKQDFGRQELPVLSLEQTTHLEMMRSQLSSPAYELLCAIRLKVNHSNVTLKIAKEFDSLYSALSKGDQVLFLFGRNSMMLVASAIIVGPTGTVVSSATPGLQSDRAKNSITADGYKHLMKKDRIILKPLSADMQGQFDVIVVSRDRYRPELNKWLKVTGFALDSGTNETWPKSVSRNGSNSSATKPVASVGSKEPEKASKANRKRT